MVKVNVEAIVLNLTTNSPVVILKSKEGQILPIVIGIFEAQSILLVLEKSSFPRPLTHDLTKNIIKNLGAEVVRVEIHSLKDNIYYADIILKKDDEIKRLDCRPSDGIALALRFNAPIFVSEELLEDAEIIKYYEGKEFLKSNDLNKPIGEKEAEEFRKIIENLSAKEFWKKLKEE
ncbi:MAG: bifunctional nuclease family protein [Candidatus Omnitrophota bacterium]|nr:MAG: bifunctional nuclease family protein [Candidatus Omnitrophota bacterium]HDN97936.1 bifunctional nuclease family protein [bacterium]